MFPASQHPLEHGRFPGIEFKLRLEAAAERYHELLSDGKKVEFFLGASRHHDARTGRTDRVALYDAAAYYLVVWCGIPPEVLHGEDWIQAYRPEGIYNGAEEIEVLAAAFKDGPKFESAEYICSPGQQYRAEWYALGYETPIDVWIPASMTSLTSSEQFHSGGLQQLVLNGLARTFDPKGQVALAHMTRNRIPADGNISTMSDILPLYAGVPWHPIQDTEPVIA